MSTLTTEALLTDFYAHLRAGNRREGFELIEPALSTGDVRLLLAHATAKVEDNEGAAAAALLMRHEMHSENSHYALLAGVTARLAIQQIGEWGKRAEQQLLQLLNSDSAPATLVQQLQRYIQLCRACDVASHPDIRAALGALGLAAPEDVSTKARFLGFRDGRQRNQIKFLSIPAAPLFLESTASDWQPRVAQRSIVDVDPQDFKTYRNVRLYMLPFMYGLIEVEEGVFLGDIVGGCNQNQQGIVTQRGSHTYKNLADPMLKRYPERRLMGSRMVPFRLAGTYYFHFATETLQSIHEFQRRLHNVPIVLPRSPGFFDRIPRRVHDRAVESIRVEGTKLEFVEDGIYRLDEIVVPTRIKYARVTYQKSVLDALNLTDDMASSDGKVTGEVIYIARRQSMVRAVQNEEDLVNLLSARFPTFRRIYLEEMSFADQVATFRGASVIIAPHGGGLTNMIYCRPGAAVIEFHMPETPIMYWHLAVLQRLRYLAYVPESYDPATSRYDIQPDQLVAAVEAIGQSAPFDPDTLSTG
jgi:hypothetical protein